MKRPALHILVPLCFGIALSHLFKIPLLFSISAAVIFLSTLFIFRTKKLFSQSALILAIFFSGMALYSNSNIIARDDISNFIPPDEMSRVVVKGVVADDPVAGVTPYKTSRTSFILKANMCQCGAEWRKAGGLVRVYLFSKYPRSIFFDNEISVEGVLSQPRGLKNPGLFDYAGYLGLKNIYCCMSSGENDALQVIRHDPAGSIKLTAYRIRHRMASLIDACIAMPYSGFLKAVLLGDRTDLVESVQEDFIKTGTVHVIAVSGLHVGLIAAIFLAIFALVRAPKKVSLSLTTVILIYYAFIAGSNPPIIRAVIIFVIYTLGYLINRDSDALNSLSIAAVAMLIWNPKQLYDPGFQLSFVSIASTLIFAPKIYAVFQPPAETKKSRNRRMRTYRYIAAGAAVSIAAWIGSFPIVASYFNIFSPISVIANFIAVPMLFFIIAVSFIFFASFFALPPAAAFFAQALQASEKILFAVNNFMAGIPFAFFRIAKPSPIFVFLFYAAAFLFIMPPAIEFKKLKIKKIHIAITLLTLLNISVWVSILADTASGLRITFFDVGKGDSAFLEFPGGHNILIDAGSGSDDKGIDMGKSVIAPSLWNKGAGAIDLLVISHFHEDHAGGVFYILKNFKVGCIVDSGLSYQDPELYRKYEELVKKMGIRRIKAGEGDRIETAEGAELYVLNPRKDKIFGDANNDSIVMKVVWKNFDLLFCGDMQDKAMSRLAGYGDFLKSEIIKVPHHGGRLGNEEIVINFFNTVSPEAAVISAGGGAKINTPSRDTLAIVTNCATNRYVTKYDGAVELFLDQYSGTIKRKIE